MRIFLSVTSVDPDYGGPAVSVPSLAKALAELGEQVGLWAPDGSVGTTMISDGVMRLSGPFKEALDRFGRPDFIHDNGVWLRHNHAIALAAKRARVPRVVTPRGMLEPWAFSYKPLKKRIAFALYQKRDLASAALLHATAENEAQALARFGFDVPIRVVPNGMELPHLERAPAEPSGERIALFLSRVHPKKGLPMLIEAWAALRPKDWRLVIAGPEELGHAAELEALAAKLGLSKEISLVGPQYGADKASLFARADLFVLPTYSENFGMAVAEALAHEVPVLTTTGAPWEDLLTHRCGWWVAPTPDGVREGLRAALASNETERRAMGERGRALIADAYGWDRIARRMVEMYRELT